MIKKIKNYLSEPKSKIGWVHGLLTCIGATICAYLTMMLFTTLIGGDYVYKIIPSMIITPVLISAYGLWLLFSNTLLNVLKKIIFSATFFTVLIFLAIKVF